jgi:hypothetical protein
MEEMMFDAREDLSDTEDTKLEARGKRSTVRRRKIATTRCRI